MELSSSEKVLLHRFNKFLLLQKFLNQQIFSRGILLICTKKIELLESQQSLSKKLKESLKRKSALPAFCL